MCWSGLVKVKSAVISLGAFFLSSKPLHLYSCSTCPVLASQTLWLHAPVTCPPLHWKIHCRLSIESFMLSGTLCCCACLTDTVASHACPLLHRSVETFPSNHCSCCLISDTLYCCACLTDIVGFTRLSSKLPTAEIFLMLSNM